MNIQQASMTGEFQISGSFYLPASPSRNVSGTVYFSPTEIRLELSGYLEHSSNNPAQLFQDKNYECIFGNSHEYGFSLYGCVQTNTSFVTNPSATGRTVFDCAILITSETILQEDIKIDKLLFHLQDIESWIDEPAITYLRNKDQSIEIKYTPVVRDVVKNQHGTLEVINRMGFHSNRSSYELTCENWIELKFHSRMKLQQACDEVAKIQSLITMLTLNMYPIDKIEGHTPTPNKDSARVRIFFPTGSISVKPKTTSETTNKFSVVSKKLEKILSIWYSEMEKDTAIYDAFLTSFYSNRISPESHFLNAIRALEAYHRLHYGGTVLAKAEFKREKSEVENSIRKLEMNAELKESFVRSIQHANELSLKKRMIQLYGVLEGALGKSLMTNTEDFSKQVTDERNRLAHLTGATTPIKLQHLVQMTQELERLMYGLLLIRHGLDSSDVLTALRHRRFRKITWVQRN